MAMTSTHKTNEGDLACDVRITVCRWCGARIYGRLGEWRERLGRERCGDSPNRYHEPPAIVAKLPT